MAVYTDFADCCDNFGVAVILMNFEFNYLSAAARKSRLLIRFSKEVQSLIAAIVVLIIIVGLGLALTSARLFGMLVAAPGLAVLPLLLWIQGDVRKMKPTLRTLGSLNPHDNAATKLETIMDPEQVGRLRDIKAPYSIWLSLKNTWYAHTFCARFGVHPELFEYLSKEQNKVAVNNIFSRALHLSQKHSIDELSPVALLISLLESFPNFDSITANLKLDDEELEEAIRWIHNERDAIDGIHRKDAVGGLARDWTSGFTPTLNRLAYDVTGYIERGGLAYMSLGMHQRAVDEMITNLTKPRGNVLLLGEVGSGRSMSVNALAKRLVTDATLPQSIRYNKIYKLNVSAIISASNQPHYAEQMLYNIVVEAQRAKDVILFFDNAIGLFRGGEGTPDLSRAVLDIIKLGANPVILEMTPSEWQQVSAHNQELAGLVNLLNIVEANEKDTMDVLEDHCLELEGKNKVIVTYKALKECMALSRRYVEGLVFPGKAINLLESAVSHADGLVLTEVSVQKTIEAVYGVKAQVATAVEGQQLLSLEEQIHKRMINQSRAVKVVSDALRRARSGVGNPNKPIGTFLFLGPTGVGKTELSKALSEVYFGDEAKIVRLNMNEYTQSSDIGRLVDIGSPTNFLPSVGRNRFTVVLFDEIEKAHPDVVNAFLQLLDEGEMRDVNNRPVSFKDTIVIATSNAGADKIRQYIDRGMEVEQFEQQFINELIDSNVFKPEFLNRFDETVVFRPLKPEELLQVVDLLISGVNRTIANQKVSVALSAEAKHWLVERGNDPRLGARPLKRMVQRTVENIVAKKMLSGQVPAGSLITLGVADLEAEQG